MNKRVSGFIAGALTTALIGSLGVGALAASGTMTITVDPVSVQVNGAVFAPKDANGKDVPVFAYQGTTYAPLRALAEAYGLEVGYDAASNMATVSSEATPIATAEPTTDDTTHNYSFDYSYEEFKGLWDIELQESGGFLFFISSNESKLEAWWNSVDGAIRNEYLVRITLDEFQRLGDNAPPKSMFRYSANGRNLAVVWPANNNEVTVY